MMSAYLYYVFLLAWCLLNWMMTAYLYDVCSTVCLLTCKSLPTCMMSALLWCPYTCMMSAYLYDFRAFVWCLPTCTKFPTCIMSAYQYDVCSTVIYAFLYNAFPPVRHVLFVWRLRTSMMSAQLCDVCLLVWSLPSYMSVSLYNFFWTEWCLPTCTILPVSMLSAQKQCWQFSFFFVKSECAYRIQMYKIWDITGVNTRKICLKNSFFTSFQLLFLFLFTFALSQPRPFLFILDQTSLGTNGTAVEFGPTKFLILILCVHLSAHQGQWSQIQGAGWGWWWGQISDHVYHIRYYTSYPVRSDNIYLPFNLVPFLCSSCTVHVQ